MEYSMYLRRRIHACQMSVVCICIRYSMYSIHIQRDNIKESMQVSVCS